MKHPAEHLVELDMKHPIWDRFFTVAPLVVIGTRERHGPFDLAPKHMATPIGWKNYFGFVCTPAHRTYQNIEDNKCFSVTFPKPSQIVLASLAAAPRDGEDCKSTLLDMPTFAAQRIDAPFLVDGYVFLECMDAKVVGEFGPNSLIIGSVAAAYVDEAALRASDLEDDEVLRQAPLLAYISPGRYASIARANAFPFPAGFRR